MPEPSKNSPAVTLNFASLSGPATNGIATFAWVLTGAPGYSVLTGRGVLDTGDGTASHLADYQALGRALDWIDKRVWLPPGSVLLIRGSSQIVLNHLNRVWDCEDQVANGYLGQIDALLDGLVQRLDITWRAEIVPPEWNEEAVRLCRLAYTQATGFACPTRASAGGR